MKIMLIARRKNTNDWKAIGEYELPVLPRVGEHVTVLEKVDEPPYAYRVVGIFHPAPNKGMIDVFAVYDAIHGDLQRRWLAS